MKQETIIEIKNMTKHYGKDKMLFDKVNLTIHEGEVLAFVGVNGVGKSTMLAIIAKLTSVNTGEIVYKKDLKFGLVPEMMSKINLKMVEYLTLLCEIDRTRKTDILRLIDTHLTDFYMMHMKQTPLKYLSKGSLQKVAIIQALLSKPDVILLDEPLSGLDKKSQNVFIGKITELKENGTAVIMSVHENTLIHTLDAKVFEIAEGGLQVKNVVKKERTAQFYMLKFVAFHDAGRVPDVGVEAKIDSDGIYFRVPEAEIERVVSVMIGANFGLRGVNHE